MLLAIIAIGKSNIVLRSKSLRQITFFDLAKICGESSTIFQTLFDNNLDMIIEKPIIEKPHVSSQTQQATRNVSAGVPLPTSQLGMLSSNTSHNGGLEYQQTSQYSSFGPHQESPTLTLHGRNVKLDSNSPSFVPNASAASFEPGSGKGFNFVSKAEIKPSLSSRTLTNTNPAPSGPNNVQCTRNGNITTVSARHSAADSSVSYYVMILTYVDLIEMSTRVMSLLSHRGKNEIVCVFSPHFCAGAVVKEIIRSLEQWSLSDNNVTKPTTKQTKQHQNTSSRHMTTGGNSPYSLPTSYQQTFNHQYGATDIDSLYRYDSGMNYGGSKYNQAADIDASYHYQNHRGHLSPTENGNAAAEIHEYTVGKTYPYHVIMSAVKRIQRSTEAGITVFM